MLLVNVHKKRLRILSYIQGILKMFILKKPVMASSE